MNNDRSSCSTSRIMRAPPPIVLGTLLVTAVVLFNLNGCGGRGSTQSVAHHHASSTSS